MNLLHLTPGTGSFHCGSCLRDNHLIKALRRLGHDATMMPLYLPLITDDAPASPEAPIFAGGIRLFLHQKLPLLRRVPWLTRWLDSRRMLLAAGKRASMTSPRQLGEMTLESLRGSNGKQAQDWQQLIDFIRTQPGSRPDVISLSNGLLTGLAPAIQRDLGVPVICSLQGEDSFLDTLPEPWRTQCWDLFRENCRSVARCIATSDWYAATMRERLGLSPDKLVRVHNGMDFSAYTPQDAAPQPPVIGFLARLIAGKGLGTLVDAFILLAPRLPEVRLALGGTKLDSDDKFIGEQKQKLERAGLSQRVEWRPNLSLEEKVQHLRSLTVLSVPATYGEAFGLYVIEALACGVPVVEPDHAGLGELVRATGGGLLCTPDSPAALAEALEKILTDHALRQELAATGRETVRRDFSSDAMARNFDAVTRSVLAAQV